MSDIWVLGDNRAGNTNQALALADNLNIDYEVKHLKYNILAHLPNFILMSYPWHINRDLLQTLIDNKPPKLIISAGRRSAAIAIYLKKKFSSIKLVQIMNPEGNISSFDTIILPQHDNFRRYANNIIRVVGAFNNIPLKIKKKTNDFTKCFPDAKKFIAVNIGGSNKDANFDNKEAIHFKNLLLKIAENHPIPLFFSFSRRTPNYLKQLVRENFLWPHIIYDPVEGGYNPYIDMLKSADYLICTGDSISMCSEAASSGKPLYIYGPNQKLKKHKFFIQQLVDLGIARRLDENVNHLENYKYNPLNEVSAVAKLIKQQLL